MLHIKASSIINFRETLTRPGIDCIWASLEFAQLLAQGNTSLKETLKVYAKILTVTN